MWLLVDVVLTHGHQLIDTLAVLLVDLGRSGGLGDELEMREED